MEDALIRRLLRIARPTMTTSFAARVAPLLKLAGRTGPAPAPVQTTLATLATLNQARKALPHPATPAYRLRHPVSRPINRNVASRAWPFRADTR